MFHGFPRIFYIQEQDSFTSFLPNLDAFRFFFHKISLVRLLSAMLNRSGKNRHFHLVPDIRGKSLLKPLAIKYDVSCGFLLDIIRLRSFPFFPTSLSYFSWKGIGFCQIFSVYIEIITFFCSLFYQYNTFHRLIFRCQANLAFLG